MKRVRPHSDEERERERSGRRTVPYVDEEEEDEEEEGEEAPTNDALLSRLAGLERPMLRGATPYGVRTGEAFIDIPAIRDRTKDKKSYPAQDGWLRDPNTGLLAPGQADKMPYNEKELEDEAARLHLMQTPDVQFAELVQGLIDGRVEDLFQVERALDALRIERGHRELQAQESALLDKAIERTTTQRDQHQARHAAVLQEMMLAKTALRDVAEAALNGTSALSLMLAVVGPTSDRRMAGFLFPFYMLRQYKYLLKAFKKIPAEGAPWIDEDREMIGLVLSVDAQTYNVGDDKDEKSGQGLNAFWLALAKELKLVVPTMPRVQLLAVFAHYVLRRDVVLRNTNMLMFKEEKPHLYLSEWLQNVLIFWQGHAMAALPGIERYANVLAQLPVEMSTTTRLPVYALQTWREEWVRDANGDDIVTRKYDTKLGKEETTHLREAVAYQQREALFAAGIKEDVFSAIRTLPLGNIPAFTTGVSLWKRVEDDTVLSLSMQAFLRLPMPTDIRGTGKEFDALRLLVNHFFSASPDIPRFDYYPVYVPTISDYTYACTMLERYAGPLLASAIERLIPVPEEEVTAPVFSVGRALVPARYTRVTEPKLARTVFFTSHAELVPLPNSVLKLGDALDFVHFASSGTDPGQLYEAAFTDSDEDKKKVGLGRALETGDPTDALVAIPSFGNAPDATIQDVHDALLLPMYSPAALQRATTTEAGPLSNVAANAFFAKLKRLSFNQAVDPGRLEAPTALVVARRLIPLLLGGEFVRALRAEFPEGQAPLVIPDKARNRSIALPFHLAQTVPTGTPLSDTARAANELMIRVIGTLIQESDASLADAFLTPGDSATGTAWGAYHAAYKKKTPRLVTEFLQLELTPLVAVPLLLDYIALVYADNGALGTRLRLYGQVVNEMDHTLAAEQKRQLEALKAAAANRDLAPHTTDASTSSLVAAAQRAHMPSSAYAHLAHISGRLYFTPKFKSALRAVEEYARRWSSRPDITLEELTSPDTPALQYAVAEYIAAHEMRLGTLHPRQYKKDLEIKMARPAKRDAELALLRAIEETGLGTRRTLFGATPAPARSAGGLSYFFTS